MSDVDDAIADASKNTASRPTRPATPEPNAATRTADPVQPTDQPPTYSSPPPAGGSSGKNWLIGFGVFVVAIVVIWFSGNDSKTSSTSQPPSFTYPPTTTTAPPTAPEIVAPTRPTEARPPFGQDNVLAGAQLRYCVAEKIRLDASELVVDNYNEAHVDRFNSSVGDYNNRCGHFRYREGSLQGAERAIEPYRTQLEAEGRSRIVGSNPFGANRPNSGVLIPNPQPRKPVPDPIVLAVQQRLNQLGYAVGMADGYSGQRTVKAIRKFQAARDLAPDGRATELLLLQLKANLGAPPLPSIPATASSRNTAPPPESSRDRENFKTCITGEYPSLCKHSLLTSDEAVLVSAAERHANFRTCISGEYPSLCKRRLLTENEVAQVDSAERRANYRTCISGEYPGLCKHGLLTPDEAQNVAAAERVANYRTCISGEYPSLCKHSLLTPEQSTQVAEAERAANLRTCLSGNYANLCKRSVLSAAEVAQVAAAERLAATR